MCVWYFRRIPTFHGNLLPISNSLLHQAPKQPTKDTAWLDHSSLQNAEMEHKTITLWTVIGVTVCWAISRLGRSSRVLLRNVAVRVRKQGVHSEGKFIGRMLWYWADTAAIVSPLTEHLCECIWISSVIRHGWQDTAGRAPSSIVAWNLPFSWEKTHKLQSRWPITLKRHPLWRPGRLLTGCLD